MYKILLTNIFSGDIMRCPSCDSENNDNAKFCKKCGAPLKNEINHQKMINSHKKSTDDDTTKYIIIALAIIAIALAGAFVYIYGFGSNHSDSQSQVQDADDDVVTTEASEPVQSTPKTQSMSIMGGSFYTGTELSDKTYATIYVGPQHAGESVIVQIYYSRDGNLLNNGNMVPVTVDSTGNIYVRSADSYKTYMIHQVTCLIHKV